MGNNRETMADMAGESKEMYKSACWNHAKDKNKRSTGSATVSGYNKTQGKENLPDKNYEIGTNTGRMWTQHVMARKRALEEGR